MNDPEFNSYANKVAKNIVTHLYKDGRMTWRQAAANNTNSRRIFSELIKEMKTPSMSVPVHYEILRNAELIKTIPQNIAGKVTEKIAKESLTGRRASDIVDDIKTMFPKLTENQAKTIARTETSKTSTALTRARCENMNINWYIWRTSEDVRVRSSHSHMEGVLVCWGNPPSPEKLIDEKFVGYYHAGEIYNCRCYPQPIVKLDFVKWPAKVYYQGRIQKMSRKQFEKIA